MFNFIKKEQCSHAALLVAVLSLSVGAGTCTSAYASTKEVSAQHTVTKNKIHTITIEAMQFGPKAIEVNVGDTIIWQNKDLVTHTVTADDKTFNSGEMLANHSWKWVVQKKGTFSYSCLLHPVMKGVLVVKP